MKKIYKIFLSLLSFVLCFQLIACSFTKEDAETIASVVSTISEIHEILTNTEENTPIEEVTDSSVTASSIKEETEASVTKSDEQEPSQEEIVNKNDSEDKESVKNESTKNQDETQYKFRNNNLLTQHYEKHGIEMGFSTKEEYEKAASAVVNNPDALHKKEKEDNDDIYYIEKTNEFVVVSTDGYIRTYFKPDAGIKYYNKQ